MGFPLLWLRLAGASWWWLVLVIGSWDVWATYSGGNVEGLLLVATLIAARLLWTPRPLGPATLPLAAALNAFVVLARPFYALFDVAFGLVLVHDEDRRGSTSWRALVGVMGLIAVLLGAEGARWGPALRVEALSYLTHTLDAQWIVLPVAVQTPMSAWNRTLLQALIALGLPAAPAHVVATAL